MFSVGDNVECIQSFNFRFVLGPDIIAGTRHKIARVNGDTVCVESDKPCGHITGTDYSTSGCFIGSNFFKKLEPPAPPTPAKFFDLNVGDLVRVWAGVNGDKRWDRVKGFVEAVSPTTVHVIAHLPGDVKPTTRIFTSSSVPTLYTLTVIPKLKVNDQLISSHPDKFWNNVIVSVTKEPKNYQEIEVRRSTDGVAGTLWNMHHPEHHAKWEALPYNGPAPKYPLDSKVFLTRENSSGPDSIYYGWATVKQTPTLEDRSYTVEMVENKVIGSFTEDEFTSYDPRTNVVEALKDEPSDAVRDNALELAQIEVMNARADLAARLEPFFSRTWIYREIFKLNYDEIEAMKAEEENSKPYEVLLEEDRANLDKFRKQFTLTLSGPWVSPTTELFKKLDKPYPYMDKVDSRLEEKWAPLLGGLDGSYRTRTAEIFETEALALRALSEEQREAYFDGKLKYTFPAIRLNMIDYKTEETKLREDVLVITEIKDSPCRQFFVEDKPIVKVAAPKVESVTNEIGWHRNSLTKRSYEITEKARRKAKMKVVGIIMGLAALASAATVVFLWMH